MSKAMSLKAKIRNIAKKKNIPAQVILQNYMFERLLVRLSASAYKEKFVLKGGMLVAAIVGLDNRATMDLDTTLKNLPLTPDAIRSALEQVCAYVGESPEIDLEAVRAIVQPPLDAKVFAMIDDIMAGNMARAQIAAKTLVDEGESRVGILALIIRQLRLMTDIRLLQDARKTAPEIAQALKLSDFVYRKTAGSVRSLAAPEILAAIQFWLSCLRRTSLTATGVNRGQCQRTITL